MGRGPLRARLTRHVRLAHRAGGFAAVYLYRQDIATREVAIKVLRQVVDEHTDIDFFHAEANVMAQLSGHPSIAPDLRGRM